MHIAVQRVNLLTSIQLNVHRESLIHGRS